MGCFVNLTALRTDMTGSKLLLMLLLTVFWSKGGLVVCCCAVLPGALHLDASGTGCFVHERNIALIGGSPSCMATAMFCISPFCVIESWLGVTVDLPPPCLPDTQSSPADMVNQVWCSGNHQAHTAQRSVNLNSSTSRIYSFSCTVQSQHFWKSNIKSELRHRGS